MARTRIKKGVKRARRGKRHIPIAGERVMTPDGSGRAMEVTRPGGVIGATVRLDDRDLQKTPSGGMLWYPCRTLKPIEDGQRGGRTIAEGAVRPRYVCVATHGTKLWNDYDYAVHAPNCECKERRDANLARCDVWPRYEHSPAAVVAVERQTLRLSGVDEETIKELRFKIFECAKRAQRAAQRAARKAAEAATAAKKSPDLQGIPVPLQSTARPARVDRARTQPTTTKGGPTMARTATRTKGQGTRSKAKAETNGTKTSKTRLTHEDKVKLVPQIVKRLKGGETFQDIRNDPDMPSSGLRRALADAGYNTKGEKTDDVEDLSDLEGAKLTKAVIRLREDGKPMYYIALAADMSEAALREILEEEGREDLVGRQARAEEEEEPAPKTSRKRSSGRSTRGKAKVEEAEAEEEAPARRRGGRRRGRSNPS